MSSLTVVIGSTVVLDILGHSASNGAAIPADAAVSITSNAPEVATVPATATPDGSSSITGIPVTIVATGSTDISASVSPKDGTGPFVDTATLLVTPLPVPGLARIEVVLRQV